MVPSGSCVNDLGPKLLSTRLMMGPLPPTADFDEMRRRPDCMLPQSEVGEMMR